MVNNHLLTGMILQVGVFFFVSFIQKGEKKLFVPLVNEVFIIVYEVLMISYNKVSSP